DGLTRLVHDLTHGLAGIVHVVGLAEIARDVAHDRPLDGLPAEQVLDRLDGHRPRVAVAVVRLREPRPGHDVVAVAGRRVTVVLPLLAVLADAHEDVVVQPLGGLAGQWCLLCAVSARCWWFDGEWTRCLSESLRRPAA